MSVAIIAAEE